MTREIKFRYKTKHGMEVFSLDEISQGVPYPIEDFRGQFTGLKDKNGVEIYEGDLVKVCEEGDFGNRSPDTCEVVQTDTGWALKGKYWYSIKEAEKVIGNIYENPELLNESN